ncbi:MAG TPA: class I SAM-dependent methyltransferase [Dehalococcoidia bacterium]|nr:class I SAM-dependent methyltransferase [Dehalococcoidia bacterium]
MNEYNEYIETNRLHWDEAVPIHLASDFYDVASFKRGRTSLLPLERDEVGEVRGKTLLHLQCHFGLDTLSWAREGALVTGVDFSRPAIEAARKLGRELGIEARFIESNIYELPSALDGQFDLVFTSYGVLCWLPDIEAWARVVARYVKPGGSFYIVDGHPLYNMIWDSSSAGELRLGHSYFGGEPMPSLEDGTYADRTARLQNNRTYEFDHGLGVIVTSLISAGLEIEFLREHPFSGFEALPGMTKGSDGFYHLPPDVPPIPILFSLRATKPA